MSTPINVLLVEDRQDDADLLLAGLHRAGFDPAWKRVQTEPEFLAEIKKSPDIILSDYSLPQFSGLRAAQLLQGSGLDIPFILVSGTMGEEIAVEAMKCGATDYLLKDRIERLGSSVGRALEQKRLRAELKQDELELKLFRTLVDHASDGIEVIDPDTGRFLDVNETVCRRLGYSRQEMLRMRVPDIEVKGVDASTWRNVTEARRRAGIQTFEGERRRKDGSTFPVEVSIRYVKLERDYLIASVRDITRRKLTEETLRELEQEQRRLAGQLEKERARLVVAQGVAKVGSWETDLATLSIIWSEETHRIFETDPATFHPTHQGFLDLLHPDDRAAVAEAFVRSVGQTQTCVIEHRLQMPDGRIKFVQERWQAFRDDQGKPVRAIGTCQDITERRHADENNLKQLRELRRWHEAMLGREDRILALKQEVNELLAQAQQPARYAGPPTS